MVEGNGALVGEEYLPFGELDCVFGGAGLREEGLREGFWEGAAGDGDFEGVVALDSCVLALDHVGAEGCGEGVDGGEGEEIGLSSHREGVLRLLMCGVRICGVVICTCALVGSGYILVSIQKRSSVTYLETVS